jgi:hypothetical protein
MKGIKTFMLCRRTRLLLGTLLFFSALGWADDKVTRAYMLTYVEFSNISRVINIAVRDTAGGRIIAGQGKHLVITDTPDQQNAIAQLLPALDQPIAETDPDKIQMKMLMNASQYLRRQKLAMKSGSHAGTDLPVAASNSPAAANAPAGGVATYDKRTSTGPYHSVYASDDARLLQKSRMFYDEPALPALSALKLKGIFKLKSVNPVALLSYENSNYIARDGGLFENNKARVKNVTSKVFKDRVILVGPDHIPREIKFNTSL